MRAAKKTTDQDLYEASVHDEAVTWTAFIQVAPGDRRRADFSTKEEAIEGARKAAEVHARSVLIYATNKADHDIMIGTVNRAGEFISALRLR